MARKVKARPRAYHSPRREEAARKTRARVLAAARELFLRHGYAATTVAAIAKRSGVVIDTVYETAGRKPDIFRLLVETAISGEESPVPSEDRGYVKEIRGLVRARRKLEAYANALIAIHKRLAPLILVLRAAAPIDPALAALWHAIAERRAQMMKRFADNLAHTGDLRPDLTTEMVADILWSLNSPEYYILLVDERHWSPDKFRQWLIDAWCRLLLKPAWIDPPRPA